jgi:DNA-directed RNA polymerase subunit M/transcription elongation factor TFIIS
MSGNIGKKLYSYRKVVTTNVKRSAPKAPSNRGEENESANKTDYIVSQLGPEYANLTPDEQYELLLAKMSGAEISSNTSVWDLPTLSKFKQAEKHEIEETLYKNELIEEGVHTCRRCGCKRSVVQSKQVRGLDEGESLFVTCTQCRFRLRID